MPKDAAQVKVNQPGLVGPLAPNLSPTYITFYKLTDPGIRDIREADQRTTYDIKAWEKAGGKPIRSRCSHRGDSMRLI